MFELVSLSSSEVSSSQNIIFIDSQVDNYQDLVSGVDQAEVVVIDQTRDGIAQITAALSKHQDISSVQIISHGNSGYLKIGTTELSLDNLDDYRSELQQWSHYLTEDADILLLGCKIGAEVTGEEFIQSLGEITEADIAASSNLTGYTDLNGDWQLEINFGEIESKLAIDEAALQSYQSILEISPEELVLELDFNDSGNLANDSSPNGNNDGRLINGATFQSEEQPFEKVVKLDGDDDYIAIASSQEINLASHAQRTVSVWFNADNLDQQNPQIIYEEGGGTRGLNIYLDQGQLYVGGWNQIESQWSGTYLTTDEISSDTWHHVALVLDAAPGETAIQSDVLFAYLDGIEFGRGNGSQLWSRAGGVAFGGLNFGTKLHTGIINGSAKFGFSGAIDEAKIYNQALTSEEINLLADFRQENPDEPASNQLVAQLQLDETSGTIAQDNQGNNPGSLINGAFFEPVGGELGGGVTFDGNDDYLAIANSSEINLGIHAQRTISVWFNTEDINRSTPQIIYEEGGTIRGLNLYLDQGKLYFGGWNEPETNWTGTFLASEAISSNTWHHVALVLDAQPGETAIQSDVLVAYLDGVEIGRGSGTQLWTHSAGIALGGLNQGSRFHSGLVRGTAINGLTGNIANLEIYNQALSQEAIANLADLETPDEVVVPPVSDPQKFTPDNDNFNYSGRVDWQNPQAPAFSFPGTAFEFKFTGTSLKIEFSEDNWGGENYIDVYIDGNPEPKTIQLQRQGGQPIIYDIAAGLENKVHNAVVVKRVDYLTGEFNFHGVILDGELLPAEPDSERTIEVYGDSISAGRAVEHSETGVRDPQGSLSPISNAYYSYASILARDYDAELSLVAQSGVPLIDGFGYWNNGTGTEAFYDKIKPLDNAPSWDFSNYTPDLVVIALGQNDASTIGLDRDLSSQAWKERYKQFIANLRDKYPDSYFVGMFPNMYHNPQWDIYLTEAIAEYRQEYNDQRVFSLIHEQVTPGHPRISEQQLMADTLKEFIDTTLTDNGFSWDVVE